MAITFTLTKVFEGPASGGTRRELVADVAFDASATYTTGGDTLALPGFTTTDFVHVEVVRGPSGGTTGWVARYNYGNQKLQIYTASATPGAGVALVEVASGTSLANASIRIQAFGKGAQQSSVGGIGYS